MEKKTPLYSGGTIPTVTHHSARDPRYYRTTGAVLPHGPAVLPRWTAVLPWARQSLDLNRRAQTGRGRTAGAVLPWPYAVLPQGNHMPGTIGTDVNNYIHDYLRRIERKSDTVLPQARGAVLP